MELSKLIQHQILLFDGAMGTMLQAAGMPAGALPEVFGLEHRDILTNIHRQYVEAGADVISANTFQASEHKLGSCGHSVEEIVDNSVRCARESGARFVALDIGPIGALLEPMGTMKFEEAYRMFARQMIQGERSGADFILIETLSDLYEAKAAILAAKENTSLPVLCTLTFQEDGRTFVGCDPVTAALTLSGLGADALGVNCSLGPKELLPVVDQLLRYSKIPVMVQANAGLPELVDGQNRYTITPEEYAQAAAEFARRGVRILGGCCGTTPAFIQALKEAVREIPPVSLQPKTVTAATSGTGTVFLDHKVTIIGERINPTGKKKLKEALREGRMDYILGEAIDQVQAGAEILDVNAGLPELDEAAVIAKLVKEIQGVVPAPLQIDSSDPKAVEAGVRVYNGRPVVNSVNGKESVMREIFPIVKKYGALIIGLTLDEEGIPPTAQGRLEIARRIVGRAAAYGIPREDILIDCLVLTASAQQEQVLETIRAITLVKRELGVKTVLGVSNVSFGLPGRERLNAAFLAGAFGAGLDAPILNPLSAKYREIVDSWRVLSNEDRDAAHYINTYSGEAPAAAPPAAGASSQRSLTDIILQGRKEESAPKVQEMLIDTPAIDIIDSHFIPALNTVGERFEKGRLFLPQLMLSADTVKAGFQVIKEHMERSGEQRQSRGKIIMATVQGDIHDIGKNIVRMILENYGFEVLDLGKDVPVQEVVDAARREQVRLVGLSALMTTTVQSMKETIAQARREGLSCRFFVGGAVLNPEYAAFVGADYYAKDAMESVRIAEQFFAAS